MSRRQQAIKILKRYQQALADRLADIVIENEGSLLDDATSEYDMGFTNEISDLAEKLRVVATTLSMMPPEGVTDEQDAKNSVEGCFQNEGPGVVPSPDKQITINDFLEYIAEGDTVKAAKVLCHLFGLELSEALASTKHFLGVVQADKEDVIEKLEKLPYALINNEMAGVLILRYLFGLSHQQALDSIDYLLLHHAT